MNPTFTTITTPTTTIKHNLVRNITKYCISLYWGGRPNIKTTEMDCRRLYRMIIISTMCAVIPGVWWSRISAARWRKFPRPGCTASPSRCPQCARWRNAAAGCWARWAADIERCSAAGYASRSPLPSRSDESGTVWGWPFPCRLHKHGEECQSIGQKQPRT